jgi:peptide/nickel transport system substrate-binding protein
MKRTITRRRLIATSAVAALGIACNEQAVPVPPKPAEQKPAAAAPTTAPAPVAEPTKPAAAPAATAPAAGSPAPAAATKPAEAAKPAEATKPAEAAKPAAGATPAVLTPVARNETLIMSVSDTFNQFQDATLANPFLRGQQRTGWHIVFEPLFFYNPYWTKDVKWPKGLPGRETEIPWLAESYQYSPDNTEITIKLRPGVTWSDNQPFSSKDVAFTINMLRETAPELLFSFDMKTWVKDVQAPDPQTVKIVLTGSNPHFVGRYFQWFQDLGFPFVPEHVFKGQDYKTFTNLDLSKGWPIGTGPWKLVSSSPDQKVYERRDDWWGAKTGFQRLPKPKRIIILPRFEDAKKIQLHAANEVDATHDMFPANIPALLQRSNKVIFWTDGNKPPYGSISPSAIMMGFNCSKAPFDDPEVRWAVNHALDRKQVSDVVYRGTGEVSVLPFNLLPTLVPYAEAAGDLLKKYPVDAPNPARTAEILEKKGWKKDGEGFWARGGQRFPMTVLLSPGFFQDIGPIFVTQLRRAGFDASFKSPTNFNDLVTQGEADLFVRFDTAAYRDPWICLDTYHSRYNAPNGQAAAQPYRWKNADFDKAVEEMARTQPADPKFMQLYLQAMEHWLRELPSMPTVKWYLRVPFNLTHWKGWANETNPYVGGGSWHRGGAPLLIHAIEPA